MYMEAFLSQMKKQINAKREKEGRGRDGQLTHDGLVFAPRYETQTRTFPGLSSVMENEAKPLEL